MMAVNYMKRLTVTLFVLLLSTLPSGIALGQNSESFSATLVDFSGKVTLQKPDESIWLPVEKNIPLETGDRIRTEKDAFAEILMDDGSLVKLEANAEMTLEGISADRETKRIDSSLFLWFGRVLSNWTIQAPKNLNDRLGFLGGTGGGLTLEESVGHAENQIPRGERMCSDFPITS